MSTKERKPRRTLDQDFIDGAAKLVTQEGYKNPKDRVTYLGTIDHIDIPVVRSAVLLVGQAMLGNGGGRWNTGSKDSYPDRATYPTAKSPGRDDREIATIDHETKRNEKTLGIARKPRVFANRAGGIRTHDLYHPNETDDPKRTNENQGKTQHPRQRLHQWLHLRPLLAGTCRRFEGAIIHR